MRAKRIVTGLACAGVLLLSGCDNFFVPINHGGNTTGAGDYLYVGNGTGTLAGFAVSKTGTLSGVTGTPLKLGVVPNAIAVSPNNAYLYAAAGATGVYLLTITATNGTITVGNNGAAYSNGLAPTSIVVESGGNFVLTGGLYNGASAVGLYQIGTGGGLTATGTPINVPNIAIDPASDNLPGQIAVMPNDAFVYLAMGTSGVSLFTFSTAGALASTNTILKPKTSGNVANQDVALAIDPSGRFLFVGETNTGLRVFSIGATGGLTEITGSPYKIGGQPRAIGFDSTGGFAYVLNAGTGTNSNSVSAFSISNGGVLTAVAGQPFAAGTSPVAITLDQSKKYMAVVNGGGNPDLQLYSFDTTVPGKLVPGAKASTDSTPANAVSLAGTH